MWTRRGLALGSALFVVACGGSRASKAPPCAKVNAISMKDGTTSGQSGPRELLPGESYDPRAAVLFFKAKGDKVSVESRCNARLVHKVEAMHQLAGDNVEQARSPLNIKNLFLRLNGGSDAMELQTSAHCFFRIWDPRIQSQVQSNPILAQEPSKSLLSDSLNRYQLYKSMLTSPQKLVVFAPDHSPIEFEYKLSTQDLYSEFFQKIESFKSDDVRKLVGREFSKSSVFLDELALDVCRADDKVLAKVEEVNPSLKRSNVRDLMQLTSYITTGGVQMTDLVRRKMFSNGRHKLCFSQTDFVVAPIQFTASLSQQQSAHLDRIRSVQQAKVIKFQELKADFFANKTASDKPRLIPEFYADSQPLPAPASCEHPVSKFQGLSLSHPVSEKALEYFSNLVITPTSMQHLVSSMTQMFPQLPTAQILNPITLPMALGYFNKSLDEARCSLRGFDYSSDQGICNDGTNGTIRAWDNSVGACPPKGESYTFEAAQTHLNVNASLRLSFVAPILNLARYRDTHAESLLLPIAQLRDITGGELFDSATVGDKPSFVKIRSALDELNTNHARYTERFDGLMVNSVDDDLQLNCSLRNTNSLGASSSEGKINVSGIFAGLSSAGKELVSQGFPRGSHDRYKNFAARYLMTRCINAGSQMLYNGFRQAPGLFQNLQFSETTIVASHVLPTNDQATLSSKELVESGRGVSLGMLSLLLGHSQTLNTDGTQIPTNLLGARLMGAGHIQLGYCDAAGGEVGRVCDVDLAHRSYLRLLKNNSPTSFAAGGALEAFDPDKTSSAPLQDKPTPSDFAAALPRLFAHLNFLTAPPSWLPQPLKDKYGAASFPGGGFSNHSAQYFLSAGDSGTTISFLGLFPMFMLSTVQDVPVSGGLAVIPSTGGQVVQPNRSGTCR